MWRCRARLPCVLGSFLEFSTTALVLGAGSLLVKGPSSGEMNETVFAMNFLEKGCIGQSESCEKSEVLHVHGIASTSPSPLSYLRQQPTVTKSGEAALRRLLASRAIGGYALTSDDTIPEIADRFPVIASWSTTGCLKSSLPCVNAGSLSSFLLGCV